MVESRASAESPGGKARESAEGVEPSMLVADVSGRESVQSNASSRISDENASSDGNARGEEVVSLFLCQRQKRLCADPKTSPL